MIPNAHPSVLNSLNGKKRRQGRKFKLKNVTVVVAGNGAGFPRGMHALPNVHTLIVWHWDRFHYDGVSEVETLDFRDANITDLSWLSSFPVLEELDLGGTLVSDLRPILDTKIERLRLEGEPIDPKFYYDVLPNLEAYRPDDQHFPERAWKISRKFFEAGLPITCFIDDYGDTRLRIPGWRTHKGLMSIPGDEIDAAFAAHTKMDLETFINETRVRRGERPMTPEEMAPDDDGRDSAFDDEGN